jgi:hypothetical protein
MVRIQRKKNKKSRTAVYAQIPTPTQIPSAEKIKDPKTTFFSLH